MIPYGTRVLVVVRQVSCELSYIRILYFTLLQLQADCQVPGSAPGTLRSVIEYGLPLPFSGKKASQS